LFVREQAALDEEPADLLRRRFEVSALGVVHVQVHEPLEELELPGGGGAVVVRSDVGRHHRQGVYTDESP
jgi:hypothetical protein